MKNRSSISTPDALLTSAPLHQTANETSSQLALVFLGHSPGFYGGEHVSRARGDGQKSPPLLDMSCRLVSRRRPCTQLAGLLHAPHSRLQQPQELNAGESYAVWCHAGADGGK